MKLNAKNELTHSCTVKGLYHCTVITFMSLVYLERKILNCMAQNSAFYLLMYTFFPGRDFFFNITTVVDSCFRCGYFFPFHAVKLYLDCAEICAKWKWRTATQSLGKYMVAYIKNYLICNLTYTLGTVKRQKQYDLLSSLALMICCIWWKALELT